MTKCFDGARPFRFAPKAPAVTAQRTVSALLLAVAVASCGEPALFRQDRKLRLVGQLRSDLLTSAFAERGAVLSITDEQSKALAAESAADAKRADTTLVELRDLVREDGNEPEKTALEALEGDWKKLKAIDSGLLELAVKNTNLKAAALLARDGRESTIAFSDGLEGVAKGISDPATLRTIAKCQTSALRSLSLLLLHVPSEDDAEMSRWEALIVQRNAEVEAGLEELRKSSVVPASSLDEVARHWTAFREVEKQALRLSRENSNVMSRRASLDEKPRALEATLGALDRFEAVVRSSLKTSNPRR